MDSYATYGLWYVLHESCHEKTCFCHMQTIEMQISLYISYHFHGVQSRMISVNNFFVFLRLFFFFCVDAICDLVHNMETIFHLSYVLTASGNLQFHGHHSYFRKDFQMLLTLKEGYT